MDSVEDALLLATQTEYPLRALIGYSDSKYPLRALIGYSDSEYPLFFTSKQRARDLRPKILYSLQG